jgi:nucleoid DNA-binding protein
MDKPVSISVKEWIIRNMSVKTMTPERIIEAVVNHQFDSAYIALNNCYSLEFSGWGKFYFNRKRADKKMEKLLSQKFQFENIIANEATTEKKRRNAQFKLNSALKNIETLSPKLHE